MHPYYVIRATGGLLFVIGSLVMAFNLYMTVRSAEAEAEAEAAPAHPLPAE
jgi:cytochrome c oxidase cbb3-type subunit 1